jgi:prophage DNA circulation protein
MADFIDDSDKLALGSNFVKKIDKMQAKEEAIQKDVAQVKQTLPKYNVEVTQAIKQLAESQKQNVSSQQIVELGKSILQAVTGKVTSLTQATVKEFLPIESELKFLMQLLEHGSIIKAYFCWSKCSKSILNFSQIY